MATFASWLHDQGDREDAVGYLSKYWKSVTPGKISAVSGVERHLKNIEHDYATQPEGMEDAAWRHGQAAVSAALSGLKFAVDEYHKQQAVDTAVHHGVRPEDIPVQGELPSGPDMSSRGDGLPGNPGMLPTQPVQELSRLAGTGSNLHITAAPEGTGKPRERAGEPPGSDPYPGVAQSVTDQRLDTLMAQNAAIIELLQELVLVFSPEPEIDWDALAATADYSAVPE